MKMFNDFPAHHSLHISHNSHKDLYETAFVYLNSVHNERDITDEELILCDQNNEVWEIQLYPHTPINCYYAVASTYEKARDIILKAMKEDGIE
jgi:hypothetical protein